jgi:hypothetical protein
MTDYFVLYHNHEGMGYAPEAEGDTMSFYTTKKLVEKAIGGECFMIVGMGRTNKQYYLWSHLMIARVNKEDELYISPALRCLLIRKSFF